MACAVYGQATAGDAEATQAATRLIKMHEAWGPALNTSNVYAAAFFSTAIWPA
jgi:hypothetical protein